MFVFLFAIYQYRTESIRRLASLCISLGLSISAFWLTREEGIWLIPSVALIICFTIYDLWVNKCNDVWKRVLAICLIPIGIWSISILSVSAINYHKYGVFCTVEMKAEPYKAAYGALSRVSPDRHIPYVPVTKATREEIYEVSPSFAKLKPFLEGGVGKAWASPGSFLTGFNPDEIEIAGGWFMWALRDAAAWAGFHDNGKEAMSYYSQIAREVNQACKSGSIKCGPKRASMAPPFRLEYAAILAKRYPGALFDTVSFKHIQVFPLDSILFSQVNKSRPFAEFEDLTLETISPRRNGPIHLKNQHNMNSIKINILKSLSDLYKMTMPIFVTFSFLCFLYTLFYRVFYRDISFFFVLNTALIMGVSFRIFILLLIDITSFPGIISNYLAPLYPLILIFLAMSLVDGYSVLEKSRRRGLILKKTREKLEN